MPASVNLGAPGGVFLALCVVAVLVGARSPIALLVLLVRVARVLLDPGRNT